jgi:hypothetical protein
MSVSPKVKWLGEHVGYDGEDCLIWPFGKCNGYGVLGSPAIRSVRYAHRVMCELVNGPCPGENYEAAHECGNGKLGCVHPLHVKWKTKSENQQDRMKHGTQATGKRSKISYAEAEEIRSLKGQMTQQEIADKFGISRANVSLIQLGKTHLNPTKGAILDGGGKFCARIVRDGESIYLGRHDTAEEASAAYWRGFEELRQRSK